MDTQFWLAELDKHGNPKLVDGAHSDRAGAEEALTLFTSMSCLGLSTEGRRYAIAEVNLSEPTGEHKPANQDAIDILNSI